MSDIEKIANIKKDFGQFDTFGTTRLVLYSYDDKDIDIAQAALTVLQKIASGDDWFEIDGEYPAPRDGREILLGYFPGRDPSWPEWAESRNGYRRGHWLKRSWWEGSVKLNSEGHFSPTHWKPIDGATHIEMLLEREMG